MLLKYHLESYLNDPVDFIEIYLNDSFVDSSTSGFFKAKKAYNFYLNAKPITKEGGFELRKWVSNSAELMK